MFQKFLGKPVWFCLKIVIYLLVAWSIFFSIAVPLGVFWGWNQWQGFNEKILVHKSGEVSNSFFMEKQRSDPKCKEGVSQEWIAFDEIPLQLQKAVLAAEDASFYLHPGIHLEAILAALEENKKRGKKKFGGSTLSQQLAKNLFLSDERSFERKIKELGYTLLMEKHLGKERIFEIYLNIAQWGPCQFGCEAGAQYFYGKSCANLSLTESVNMASLLAKPSTYHPENQKSKFLKARRQVIWNNLYAMRYLKKDTTQVDSLTPDGAASTSQVHPSEVIPHFPENH